jgi:hypothetical protein
MTDPLPPHQFEIDCLLDQAMAVHQAGDSPAAEPRDSRLSLNHLASAVQAEREHALEELTRRWLDEHRELVIKLEKATREHRDNKSYMSPLHVVILAAERCRAFEAENSLFSIVDYELDGRSLPNGIDVPDYYFYPAAAA